MPVFDRTVGSIFMCITRLLIKLSVYWYREEESNHRKNWRKYAIDVESALQLQVRGRELNCKKPTFGILLIFIVLGSFRSLYHLSTIYSTVLPSTSAARYIHISPLL